MRAKSICLVVSDVGSLTDTLAEYEKNGLHSHVLYCGSEHIPRATRNQLRKSGISVSTLDNSNSPVEFRVANLYESAYVDRGDRIRHALEQLHREHRFDLIEFDLHRGLGFRSLQAKQAGIAFTDVLLACRFNTCSAWQREQEQRWPSGYEEVELDFAERYSFENADINIAPSLSLLAFVGRLGWNVHSDEVFATCPEWISSSHRRCSFVDSAPRVQPSVTIGIAYYNLGRYLPETLATLAAQSYPNLEVLVIDDGSTDPHSIDVFAEMEARYPQYRFLRQRNAGIGATRNRCLSLARGEYFVPVDADNLARPEMITRFAEAMTRNPECAAMTCYFLAFEDGVSPSSGQFLHACRPTGGPHVLAGIRNVYGDANAIFRTEVFREVGGYETDRGTSCEDWEAFVKLVHAGKRIGVVPDHLFYYRHLSNGFSRTTNRFANHQRVLRQFNLLPVFPGQESVSLWTTMIGLHQRIEQLKSERMLLRYQLADRIHSIMARLPGFACVLKNCFLGIGNLLRRVVGSLKRQAYASGSFVGTGLVFLDSAKYFFRQRPDKPPDTFTA